MHTLARMPETPSTIEQVRAQLWEIIEDGLRHGFFEFAVSCEIVKDKKRRLVIRAGKSHQYTIAEHELPAR
ncbi:MAG: hypothetical protein M3Q10_07765 [Chloroflexota bacterium]|nr:hypothetical protein [Chloroflexota bacterium]